MEDKRLTFKDFDSGVDHTGYDKRMYLQYSKLTAEQVSKIHMLAKNIGNTVYYQRGKKLIPMTIMHVPLHKGHMRNEFGGYPLNIRLNYADDVIREHSGFWTYNVDNILLVPPLTTNK